MQQKQIYEGQLSTAIMSFYARTNYYDDQLTRKPPCARALCRRAVQVCSRVLVEEVIGTHEMDAGDAMEPVLHLYLQ